MDPLVSIIVPTFNRSAYLKKCVDCILSQTYSNFEVVIIDDASTDDTGEIIKKYDDDRIRYFNYGKIKNISKSRNLGISLAKGDVIAFTDDDDKWNKTKLELQMKYLGNYDFICTNGNFINEDDEIIHQKLIDVDHNFLITTESLLYVNLILTSSVLIKKEVLLNSELFDENKMTSFSEDYQLWLKISLKTKILFLNELLTLKRIHSENISHQLENIPKMYENAIESINLFQGDEDSKIKNAAKGGIFRNRIFLIKFYLLNKKYFLFSKEVIKILRYLPDIPVMIFIFKRKFLKNKYLIPV